MAPKRPRSDDPPQEIQPFPPARGVSPLVYELFVLGELAVNPLYGYLLHDIADRILGPLTPLSWGTLYPLIRRLERDGLIESATEPVRADFPRKQRGQARRVYSITPSGRERFMALMLAPTEYSRDTPKLFIVKLTKFQFLTPVQRLTVLTWYRGYLRQLHEYYRTAAAEVVGNPQIQTDERPWILRSIEYPLRRLVAEIAWLESVIAESEREMRG